MAEPGSADTGGRGLRQIVLLFFSWKVLLVAIACGSPGVGYDTSTRILFDQYPSESTTWLGKAIEHAVLRLTRWDGIYFSTLAQRGHLHEQDWAFSWLLTRCVDWMAKRITPWPGIASSIVERALLCILVSHVAHLFAVLVLYRLTLELIPRSIPSRQRVAFTAAALHILSPAGIFLSAPSGESAFAWFNFVGTLCYAYSTKLRFSSHPSTFRESLHTILSGLAFGIASMMRGNGLLNGIIFALDALQDISRPRILFSSIANLERFAATIMGGLLVGVGYTIPQAVAYAEYCGDGPTRPWCNRFPPSIFSWVQSHYWRVGFLRYWTLSNAPLFLIATPMLVVLLLTGNAAVRNPTDMWRTVGRTNKEWQPTESEQRQMTRIFRRLAAPQLVLTVLTTTTFHVQIINRISSGCPLWYVVLAAWIESSWFKPHRHSRHNDDQTDDRDKHTSTSNGTSTVNAKHAKTMQWVVRSMMVYAVVQGGLYACFLPPA